MPYYKSQGAVHYLDSEKFEYLLADDAVKITDDEANLIRSQYSAQVTGAQAINSISMRQGRLALLQAGLLDDVLEVVALASKEVQISFEYATELHRHDPVLALMASAMSLTDTQIDELFRQASFL